VCVCVFAVVRLYALYFLCGRERMAEGYVQKYCFTSNHYKICIICYWWPSVFRFSQKGNKSIGFRVMQFLFVFLCYHCIELYIVHKLSKSLKKCYQKTGTVWSSFTPRIMFYGSYNKIYNGKDSEIIYIKFYFIFFSILELLRVNLIPLRCICVCSTSLLLKLYIYFCILSRNKTKQNKKRLSNNYKPT